MDDLGDMSGLLARVLGNSTEWIFDIRRLDQAQKGGFHYPYWILGRRILTLDNWILGRIQNVLWKHDSGPHMVRSPT